MNISVQTDEEYYADKFRENPGELRTGGKVYRPEGDLSGRFRTGYMINRSGFGTNTLLVLPDEAVKDRTVFPVLYGDGAGQRQYGLPAGTHGPSGIRNDHDGASFIVTYTYAGQKMSFRLFT